MKKTWLFLLATLLSFKGLSAQTPAEPQERIYEVFDLAKAPSFPGGDIEMYKAFNRLVLYPSIPNMESLKATQVIISFVIDTTGALSDFQILKEPAAGFGQAVIQVFKALPKWSPAEANGHPVKSRYIFPIRLEFK